MLVIEKGAYTYTDPQTKTVHLTTVIRREESRYVDHCFCPQCRGGVIAILAQRGIDVTVSDGCVTIKYPDGLAGVFFIDDDPAV